MVIVDTSVAIKWYFNEEGSPEARSLLDKHDVGAPDLLYYEFANFLSNKNFITAEEARGFLSQLYALPLQVFLLPQKGFHRAIELAKRFGLSLYDAAFVSLAETLHGDLITADRKLAQKVKALSFVRLLN